MPGKNARNSLINTIQLIGDAKLTYNFKPDKSKHIQQSDRVKTSWKVGGADERNVKSGDYRRKREAVKTKMLGYDAADYGTRRSLRNLDYAGEDQRYGRPKYVAMNYSGSDYGAASWYGGYAFNFKDHVKDRTSFLGGDSFHYLNRKGKGKNEAERMNDLMDLFGTTDNYYAVLAYTQDDMLKALAKSAHERFGKGQAQTSKMDKRNLEGQVLGNLEWSDVEEMVVPYNAMVEATIDKPMLQSLKASLSMEDITFANVVWDDTTHGNLQY